MSTPNDNTLCAISRRDIGLLDAALIGKASAKLRAAARSLLDKARDTPVVKPEIEIGAARQRDFLVSQVQSAVHRMAGEIVARGLMSIGQAGMWANDELAKVQAGLAAIEQANQPKESGDD